MAREVEEFPYFTEFLLTVGSLDYFNNSLKKKGEHEQAAIATEDQPASKKLCRLWYCQNSLKEKKLLG